MHKTLQFFIKIALTPLSINTIFDVNLQDSRKFIPEYCMRINEMLGLHIITKTCENLRNIANSPISKKDDGRFYLINFHPAGEPEAFICFVIKGSA